MRHLRGQRPAVPVTVITAPAAAAAAAAANTADVDVLVVMAATSRADCAFSFLRAVINYCSRQTILMR